MKMKKQYPIKIIILTALIVSLLFGSVVTAVAFFDVKQVREDYKYQLYQQEQEFDSLLQRFIGDEGETIHVLNLSRCIIIYQDCSAEDWYFWQTVNSQYNFLHTDISSYYDFDKPVFVRSIITKPVI